jgi:hypothetical protein
MCALVARRAGRLFRNFKGEVRATVEWPCGRGFVDVYAETDAPPNEVQRCIVEVKTRSESESAGDVIRQVKWYRQHSGHQNVSVVVVVENDNALPSVTLELLLREGIEVLPIWYFEQENVA